VRILIDECLPQEIMAAFRAAEILSVPEAGLAARSDTALLDAMEGRFEVFVTVDKSLRFQHDLARRRVGFRVLRAESNRIETFLPHFATLRAAAFKVKPGQVLEIDLEKTP